MEKIKVIFLDVDGVLNSDRTVRKTQGGYTFVDNRQMKNLKHIINMTGAKVVLSSDWRYDRDDPRYNGDYLELEAELLKYGIRLYGFTPELPSCHRGMEIDCWLKEHSGRRLRNSGRPGRYRAEQRSLGSDGNAPRTRC